jgi:predicted kinase
LKRHGVSNCADQRTTLLVLVGLPGAGKSVLARSFADAGWSWVRMDDGPSSLASCKSAARCALAAGCSCVIDRCNVDVAQRRAWLQLAAEFRNVRCSALYLDVERLLCEQRVVSRGEHRLPVEAAMRVIHALHSALSEPDTEEGFDDVHTVHDASGARRVASESFGVTVGPERVSGGLRTLPAAPAPVAAAGARRSPSGRRDDTSQPSADVRCPTAQSTSNTGDAETSSGNGELLLHRLEAWLRASFPQDVPIPCERGQKRPAVPYRLHGQWTWASFDALDKTAAAPLDWAIQLRDLCVVDVDSPQVRG